MGVEEMEELSTMSLSTNFWHNCIRWRYKTRMAYVPSQSDVSTAISCNIEIYTISGLICTDASEELERLAAVFVCTGSRIWADIFITVIHPRGQTPQATSSLAHQRLSV
jgi:hypothetical protein